MFLLENWEAWMCAARNRNQPETRPLRVANLVQVNQQIHNYARVEPNADQQENADDNLSVVSEDNAEAAEE